MGEIGTLAWARAGGGALTARERMAFAARGVASQMRTMPPRLAAALGLLRGGRAAIDLDSLRLPDTRAAREAEEACAALPASLAAHSHRTFLWGAALAQADRLDFDEEMLYTASLLHDVALPGATEADGVCFTLLCGEHAAAIADRAGWDPARSDAMFEALTLHLNPAVPLEHGAEAHLLNAGAALDVVGMRAWEIDRETRAAVLERHPRGEFKRELVEMFRAHARSAPRGRVAFLMRYGGFAQLVRRAPFDG